MPDPCWQSERFWDNSETWVELALSKIEEQFQHQENIRALPIAQLNNVLRGVNGNPALELDKLLPYPIPGRAEQQKFPVAASTARAFLDCLRDGVLPEWMLVDLAKYLVGWREIANRG